MSYITDAMSEERAQARAGQRSDKNLPPFLTEAEKQRYLAGAPGGGNIVTNSQNYLGEKVLGKNFGNFSNPFDKRSGIGSREGLDGLVDPNLDARRRQLLQEADFAAGRQAGRFGQNQGNLVSMLEAQARGEGPSVAQNQMRDALQRNVSTQQALLASGGNARAAAQQAGALGGSIGYQTGMARVQEQLGAQGLLSQSLGQFRGQDIQQMGLNDQMKQFALQQELENARLRQTGTLGMAEQLTARRGQDLGVPTMQDRAMGALSSYLGSR